MELLDGSATVPAAAAAAQGSTRLATKLSEAAYFSQVFILPEGSTEAEMDEALAKKAAALGISTDTQEIFSPLPYNLQGQPPDADSGCVETPRLSRSNSASSLDGSTPVAASTAPVLRPPPSRGADSDISVSASSLHTDALGPGLSKRRSRSLSFSQYEKYLAQVDPNLKQPKFVKESTITVKPTPGFLSTRTRKSIVNIKRTLKTKVRWRRSAASPLSISCICCRDDFGKMQSLHVLPCGHTYCSDCLGIMIKQSGTDESKMPPRCCTQPIPAHIVKAVLDRADQQVFLKAVVQFSTPWEARIFCPNSACGEFIRPRTKADPKHPFDVSCRKCRAQVCIMCKRESHPPGQDCPADFELEAVLKMGEKSGWRRCYKCRTLVELSQGCTHMTCRCKAQFCYICGAVWDGAVGCPNYCNGEEELERRRLEEEARLKELAAEKEAQEQAAMAAEAERLVALQRTAASPEFSELAKALEGEKDRMVAYEAEMKSWLWTQHNEERLGLLERFSDQVEKMKERHAKTTQHLEDRQVTAEMDLRATLDQRARSVKIRLRHMEAYCDGLGRGLSANGGSKSYVRNGASSTMTATATTTTTTSVVADMPARVVTERDLRELGQQYNMRDDLERLHQARINVLRDRQAKNMEDLQERQQAELEKLLGRRDEEIEDLEAGFAAEDDALLQIYHERRERARRRWGLRVEILQREMEAKTDGLAFGPIPIPEWPASALGQKSFSLAKGPCGSEPAASGETRQTPKRSSSWQSSDKCPASDETRTRSSSSDILPSVTQADDDLALGKLDGPTLETLKTSQAQPV